MAKNGGIKSEDLGANEEGDIGNWSVSKLISSLKDAFQPNEFSRVERVLVEREEKLKREIEGLRQENKLSAQKSRLEKVVFEDDLLKSKKEREEMLKEVSKLREENEMLKEMKKSADERCQKLWKEVNQRDDQLKEHISMKADMEKEMIDIRGREAGLVSDNAKLKDELTVLNKRFEDLDKRLLSLESDISVLKTDEYSKGSEMAQENGNSESVAGKCNETVKVEQVSFAPIGDSPVKAEGDFRNAGITGPPSQNIIEIPDSDDDCTPAEAVSGKERTLQHPAGNSHTDQVSEKNGSPAPKRKRTLCSNVGESATCYDDDGYTSTGKSKTKKVEDPVHSSRDIPLNNQTTRAMSSEKNEVEKGPTPRSQTLLNGFPLDGLGFTEGSSSDSDSDSDDDNDGIVMPILFNHSKPALESQRENRN